MLLEDSRKTVSISVQVLGHWYQSKNIQKTRTFVKSFVGVKATNFSDFSGCSFMQCIEGMFGKNLLQISITPASIKMLVINVYFQDISSQEKFILFYLYGSASLLMFHLVYSDINISPISVL